MHTPEIWVIGLNLMDFQFNFIDKTLEHRVVHFVYDSLSLCLLQSLFKGFLALVVGVVPSFLVDFVEYCVCSAQFPFVRFLYRLLQ